MTDEPILLTVIREPGAPYLCDIQGCEKPATEARRLRAYTVFVCAKHGREEGGERTTLAADFGTDVS